MTFSIRWAAVFHSSAENRDTFTFLHKKVRDKGDGAVV